MPILCLLVVGAGAVQAQNTLSISAPANANEGDSGDRYLNFTVTLSSAISSNVVYRICLTGTATIDTSAGIRFSSSGDYQPTFGGNSATVSCMSSAAVFANATTSTAVGIRIKGDANYESDETVVATLSWPDGYTPPAGVTLGTTTATHTILNDDIPNVWWANVIQGVGNEAHIGRLNVAESSGTVQLRLQWSKAVSEALAVTAAVTGTATHGTDYTFGTGVTYANGTATFTIPAGRPRFGTVDFPLTIVNDSVSDNGETIILTIDDTSVVNLGSPSEQRITVTENSGDATFEVQGTLRLGETLTVARTVDDPDGNGTISSYEWVRVFDGRRVLQKSGASATTYTLTQGDVGKRIAVNVSYTDGNGNQRKLATPPVGPVLGPRRSASDFIRPMANADLTGPEGDRQHFAIVRNVIAYDRFGAPTGIVPSSNDYGFQLCFTGTATPNVDYSVTNHSNHPLVIGPDGCSRANDSDQGTARPAGFDRTNFYIRYLRDGETEGDETIIVTLANPAGTSLYGHDEVSYGHSRTFTIRGEVQAEARRDAVTQVSAKDGNGGDTDTSDTKTGNPPPASCVSDAQWDQVAGYYDANANKSPNYGANWYRLLIAYRLARPEKALPNWEGATARPTAAFTAEEAEEGEKLWSGWTPVREVLECLEKPQTSEPPPDPPPPPPDPELSLSAGSAVDEGSGASFTVHADSAPGADVTVNVSVAQSGDYLDAPGAGTRTVTLAAGATTASIDVATVNDSADEPDGSVSVSLDGGAGYTVASSPNDAASVAVRDDDEPVSEISISAGGDVAEGAAASFTVTASPAPASPLDIDVTVAQSGDFAASGGNGSRTVTVPASGSATLTVATEDDGADEPDGSISVSIDGGAGYTVASPPGDTATVAVRDNDDPAPAIAIGACVSGTQWKTVKGYYDANANKSPNYGANWYRVLIAYRSEHTHRALPDWTGPTAAPTAAYTVEEAEDGEKLWFGWTPVREALECLERANGGTSTSSVIGGITPTGQSGEVGATNPQPATGGNRWNPQTAPGGFGPDAMPGFAAGSCISPQLRSGATARARETWRGAAHVERWLRVAQTFSGGANDATVVTPAEASFRAAAGQPGWLPVADALSCMERQSLREAMSR